MNITEYNTLLLIMDMYDLSKEEALEMIDKIMEKSDDPK